MGVSGRILSGFWVFYALLWRSRWIFSGSFVIIDNLCLHHLWPFLGRIRARPATVAFMIDEGLHGESKDVTFWPLRGDPRAWLVVSSLLPGLATKLPLHTHTHTHTPLPRARHDGLLGNNGAGTPLFAWSAILEALVGASPALCCSTVRLLAAYQVWWGQRHVENCNNQECLTKRSTPYISLWITLVCLPFDAYRAVLRHKIYAYTQKRSKPLRTYPGRHIQVTFIEGHQAHAVINRSVFVNFEISEIWAKQVFDSHVNVMFLAPKTGPISTYSCPFDRIPSRIDNPDSSLKKRLLFFFSRGGSSHYFLTPSTLTLSLRFDPRMTSFRPKRIKKVEVLILFWIFLCFYCWFYLDFNDF